MKLLLILFCSMLMYIGCDLGSSHGGVTVEDEELVDILVDLHLADELITRNSDQFRDSMRLIYKTTISEIHHLSVLQIDSILIAVQKDNERYQSLFSKALDKINIYNDSLEKIDLSNKASLK